MSFSNLRAVQPDEVKIEVPLPFGLALMISIASSNVSSGYLFLSKPGNFIEKFFSYC